MKTFTLDLDSIDVFYGRVQALWQTSFKVPEGKIVAILGSNGAGKSTILRAISGLIQPKKGKIKFGNENIEHLEPTRIFRLGISHVPQGRELFPLMSVKENLLMGSVMIAKKSSFEDRLENVYNYLPKLRERANQKAATLSGGEQQMLAIGRALMAKPKLMLLDETSAGLAPLIIKEFDRILRLLNLDGTTILMVEQNIQMALNLSSYVYILRNGKIVFSGEAMNLSSNDEIFRMYLG